MAKYEKALSKQFNEGGYTFLKRALAQNIATQQPVIINTGESYFEYSYKPGDRTFLDGAKLIEGSAEDCAVNAFSDVAKNYDVARGLQEIAEANPSVAQIMLPPMQEQETLFYKICAKLF